MTTLTPPDWYPDPSRRHEHRYWDGVQWTDNVSTNGTPAIDDHGALMSNRGEVQESSTFIDGEVMFKSPSEESVKNQVTRAIVGEESIPEALEQLPEYTETPTHASTVKSIFTENILVVNQKAKLIELTNEFRIYDADGIQIGAVREVGQSAAKKVARALTNLDSLMTHTMEITNMSGEVLLRITKPRALLKPKVIVERGDGTLIGELQIKLRIGKAQIKLLIGTEQVGMTFAENFRAWNFKIVTGQDHQVASITKTWEGLAKAMFTNADNYVVQIHEKLEDPIHSLVLASSLAVDLILKQNK